MRDLRRQVIALREQIEAKNAPRLMLLWQGDGTAEEAMLAALGTVQPPLGRELVFLRWAEPAAPESSGEQREPAPPLVIIPDPAGTVH